MVTSATLSSVTDGVSARLASLQRLMLSKTKANVRCIANKPDHELDNSKCWRATEVQDSGERSRRSVPKRFVFPGATDASSTVSSTVSITLEETWTATSSSHKRDAADGHVGPLQRKANRHRACLLPHRTEVAQGHSSS